MPGSFMNNMLWKKLSKDRLIADHPMGFSVIKPRDHASLVPLSCPLCKFMMRDQADALAYLEADCCSNCKLLWFEPNRAAWENGWRPLSETVEQEQKKRLLVPSYRVT
jgi:hypothetical protein